MSSPIIQIRFHSAVAAGVYKDGSLLGYQTAGSSGFDLRAVYITDCDGSVYNLDNDDYLLEPNSRAMIHCGVSFAVAQCHEVQIRSRSGLSWKNGVFVLNSPGTIDSDYRGEICSILFNLGTEHFRIARGDRISQAVVCPVVKPDFIFTDILDNTTRDTGGFGSTGSC